MNNGELVIIITSINTISLIYYFNIHSRIIIVDTILYVDTI